MTHVGQCFSGAVEMKVEVAPEPKGYCHCSSCRSWSGGPVNAFTLWKPDAVTVTRGAEHAATYQKIELSQRQHCSTRGGHLMTNHPILSLVDVFARRSRPWRLRRRCTSTARRRRCRSRTACRS